MKEEDESVADDAVTVDGAVAVTRADILWAFPIVVEQLGGDADALMRRAGIAFAALRDPHAMIPYRKLVHLLELTSAALDCPDFGMRLALLQRPNDSGGPIRIAMKNSPTVGDAFRYFADHAQAHATGMHLGIEEDAEEGLIVLRFEILLAKLPYQRQTVEQALLLMHQNLLSLSSRHIRPREVWFAHEPLAPIATYRRNFGTIVRFGQSMNGILLSQRDFGAPVPDVDPDLYDIANRLIEQRFPATPTALSARVHAIIERQLLAGECSFASVVDMLAIHPRTVQRRLKTEGTSFEDIKDSVRRDIALRYLRQSSMPLIRVAQLLGYSEASVLSRSCARWFSASPRDLRKGRAVVAADHLS